MALVSQPAIVREASVIWEPVFHRSKVRNSNLELAPAIAGAIVNTAGVYLATNALFQSSYGQGGGSGQNFRERVEQKFTEKMQGDNEPYAESYTLKKLSGPNKMSGNKDSLLGPNQQRWYADMENEVTGEVTTYSVNYDPDTGEFGVIKPSSIQNH